MRPRQCSNCYWKRDCSNSRKKRQQANHCCSCRPQSQGKHKAWHSTHTKSPKNYYSIHCMWGMPPNPRPLCGRLFTRKGRANGPNAIGNEIVQIHARSANKQTIAAGAAHKRIIHLTCIEPSAITCVCGI